MKRELTGVVETNADGTPVWPVEVGQGAQARVVLIPMELEEFQRQLTEPVSLFSDPAKSTIPTLWIFRNRVVRVTDSASLRLDELLRNIRHKVFTHERSLQKLKTELATLESLDQVDLGRRERIPENVQTFVWQRDGGACVVCGSKDKLEFDHIIPVVAGGSSTERNIQLLCERCNRERGARA